ncbi:MAG: GxxExxY protein [Holophaga sp.]|nr:GxxExxY protein [Holophaga sp.]
MNLETENRQDAKSPRKDLCHEDESIATVIIDAAIKVHRVLGPGLLESVYEACLSHELKKRGLKVLTQISLPVHYEDIEIESGLRIDMLVENRVIVELKAVEKVLPVHEAQLLSYLKLARKQVGFLLNFNVTLLKDGITRRIITT